LINTIVWISSIFIEWQFPFHIDLFLLVIVKINMIDSEKEKKKEVLIYIHTLQNKMIAILFFFCTCDIRFWWLLTVKWRVWVRGNEEEEETKAKVLIWEYSLKKSSFHKGHLSLRYTSFQIFISITIVHLQNFLKLSIFPS
jgi:hypothetical protein